MPRKYLRQRWTNTAGRMPARPSLSGLPERISPAPIPIRKTARPEQRRGLCMTSASTRLTRQSIPLQRPSSRASLPPSLPRILRTRTARKVRMTRTIRTHLPRESLILMTRLTNPMKMPAMTPRSMKKTASRSGVFTPEREPLNSQAATKAIPSS